MGTQALIWFTVAAGAAAFAASLLHARYVRKTAQALGSRGGFTLFAVFMLLFAIGAAVAGIASAGAGR